MGVVAEPRQNITGPPPGSALSDGQWHTVELSSRPGRLAVSVDGDEEGAAHPSSFIAEGPLFFGGETGLVFFRPVLPTHTSCDDGSFFPTFRLSS